MERVPPNRWRVRAAGVSRVTVRYGLLCAQRSVTTNWVSEDMAVLNGAAGEVEVGDGATEAQRGHLAALPASAGGA